MTLSIRYRPQSLRDIEEIAVYLGRDSIKAANRFLRRMERAVATLALFPAIGHKWPSKNTQVKGVRFWQPKGFKRYVIVYRPGHEEIEVLRVLHGSRNVGTMPIE